MKKTKRDIINFRTNKYNRIHLRIVFILFSTSILFTGCIGDTFEMPNPIYGKVVSVSLSAGFKELGTRTYDEGAEGAAADKVIQDLRVLIFDTTGDIVYNEYIADLSLSNPFQLSLRKGTYDFVFIANESSDPTLTNTLDAFTGTKNITDLINVSFSSAAFESSKNIPMSHVERNVEILDNNKFKLNATEYTGTWEVELTRLAIRLDVKIFTESKIKKTEFEGIELTNIPNSVPILETNLSGTPLYNGGSGKWESSPRIVAASDGDNGGFQSVTGGYEWICSRIILPSSVFTTDNANNAITLTVKNTNLEDETAVLKTAASTTHHALRNTYYTFEGVLSMDALEIHLDVEDWDDKLIDISLGDKALNVSRIEASINEHNMARIWFWSDQKDIFIEDLTSDGENTDDIFYDLSGIGATNMNYTYDASTGKGSGYFDVMTDRRKSLINADSKTTYKLLLNAGGLTREIKINVSIPSTDFPPYPYVGAFWRNNQTGERVIAMANTGDWTASVTSGDWIILAPGKSLDEKVWTEEEPGDPEDYPVEGTATTIIGTDNIYFRIGLTGTHAGAPRYGVVTITRSNGGSYLFYIRQGEEDDYLMRPEDATQNGSLIAVEGIYRPKAVKVSPFNLTSRQFINRTRKGGPSISDHSQIGNRASGNTYATFAEYPTQAGAYFQWANATNIRYAWHPSNPSGSQSITSWNRNYPGTYWGGTTNPLKDDHETCPPGYRRPTDGKISELNDGDITYSEQRQSLYLNPPIGVSAGNTDNARWGYYADGHFDRWPIVTSTGTTSGSATRENSTVCPDPEDYRIAYVGMLFYNPNTNASVFFPASGARYYWTGGLYLTGNEGYYWSSSMSNMMDNTLHFGINQGFAGQFDNGNIYAFTIRCVVGDHEDEDENEEERWARSNIIRKADGTLDFAITIEENADIPANVQGLLFKFGSLIGINYDSGASGLDWAANHVAFVPSGYSGSSTWETYSTIKAYETHHAGAPDQFLEAFGTTGYNAAEGLGDICRYISDQQWWKDANRGKWRMPTSEEMKSLYNDSPYNDFVDGVWAEQAMTNNPSTWRGMGRITTGWWLGNSATTNMEAPEKGTVFLPASGHRNANGGVLSAHGEIGYYWSSSSQSAIYKYMLRFFDNGISKTLSPAFTNPPNHSFAVRCIREIE